MCHFGKFLKWIFNNKKKLKRKTSENFESPSISGSHDCHFCISADHGGLRLYHLHGHPALLHNLCLLLCAGDQEQDHRGHYCAVQEINIRVSC